MSEAGGRFCRLLEPTARWRAAGSVLIGAWNPQHQKLTTSDDMGVTIVWVLHKGNWREEMMNTRASSVVRGMKWQASGERICIAYEDSNVLVGSVDGNRVWGRDLGQTLQGVEWSPDGKLLLFIVNRTRLQSFSSTGNPLKDVQLRASDQASDEVEIVAVQWYDGLEGHDYPEQPSLAIAFANGLVQLMRHARDEEPCIVSTDMEIKTVAWNTAGNVLAVGGSVYSESGAASLAVRFYSPFGRPLHTLKLTGKTLQHVSWEGGGLRVAIAVDSSVFFANVRPDYRWAAFGDIVAYAYNKPGRSDQGVVFWNTRSNNRFFKAATRLISITACPSGKHCVMATGTEDAGTFSLVLCDSIGSPVHTKTVNFPPQHVTMTPMHVIVASRSMVYVWQYSATGVTAIGAAGDAASSAMAALRRTEGRERVFHIDDGSGSGTGAGAEHMPPSQDPITCLEALPEALFIGRASGQVARYTLPHVALEARYQLQCSPKAMAVNCDGTMLSVIDGDRRLHFFDTQAPSPDAAEGGGGKRADGTPPVSGAHVGSSRKDAWAMLWAEDNPALFVSMEKTRMYLIRQGKPEEPVQSSAFLTRFKDLCVTGVHLDDIMLEPLAPHKTTVMSYETRSLRDMRELLHKADLASALSFVRTCPHARLWRLLAESALDRLDLPTAERAYVEIADYQGITFVKRLRLLGDRTKQRAEVAVWFGRFDEAEAAYVSMDRHDLAIDMRIRMGDWFRVIQLASAGGVARKEDTLLTLARNSIGDYYADRQQWRKAAQYYTEAKNTEALAHCLYMQDDFDGLVALVGELPPGSALLLEVGRRLQRVGLVAAAVDALLKGGDVKGAVDACVLLNEWDRAVELAEAHDFPQIEGLLTKYGTKLMNEGKLFQAIELFRKANRATESGRMLAKLAAEAGAVRQAPMRAKKLFVLAALEVERHRGMTMRMSEMTAATITGPGKTKGGTTAATAATLDTLLAQDATMTTTGLSGEEAAAVRVLDAAWHGAEAYHFWMLAHRQLYSSDIAAALRTALRLTEYEDVLDPKAVHSLIALCAYYNGFFGQCSKAFIRLEQLGEGPGGSAGGDVGTTGPMSSYAPVTEAERAAYADLAMHIFVTHSPVDPGVRTYACPKCSTTVQPWATGCMACGVRFDACVASGRPVLDKSYTRCKRCKHKMLRQELRGRANCPLCHLTLPGMESAAREVAPPTRPAPAVAGAGSRARAMLRR